MYVFQWKIHMRFIFQHFFTWKYHIMIHSKFTFCWSPPKKGEYWKGSLLSARASEWFLLGGIPTNPLQTYLLSIRDQLGGQQQVFFFPVCFLLSEGWRIFRANKKYSGSLLVLVVFPLQCESNDWCSVMKALFFREINIDYKFRWCRNCCFLMLPIVWGYQQLAKRLSV